MKIERGIPLLEELLAPWRERIGRDYAGYRNHVYRMLHFCFVLHPPTDEQRHKLIIAKVKAAFTKAGFHKRLRQLTWQQFSQHPLDPLPMMKW
jgi:hypothetical protein